MSQVHDKAISAGLTLTILAIAAVLVHREFFAGPPEPDPPTLEYVSDWNAAVAAATLIGNPGAAVTIIEFADLQCPACRAFHKTLQNVQEQFEDEVAVAFVHFPLPYHKAAIPAARAAECARAQGKFAQFVAAAYQRQDSLGKRSWSSYAADAGVGDINAFTDCNADSSLTAPLDAGVRVATQMSITATPTIIVNGWRFSSVPSEKVLVKLIKGLRAGRSPAGNPKADVAIAPTKSTDGALTLYTHAASAFARAPQFVLDSVPEAIVGKPSEDGEYDPSRATSYVMLGDGRLVTFSILDQRVLLFSQSGNGEQKLTSRGNGPQQIAQGWNLSKLAGDTMAILDGATERLNFVVPSGGIVRSIDLRGKLPIKANLVSGGLPHGDVIVHRSGVIESPEGLGDNRTRGSVLRISPAGATSVIATIPDLEVAARTTQYFGKAGRTTELLDFTRRAHVLTWDSSVVTASGDGYRFDLRRVDGTPHARIHVERPRRPVTEAMRDSALARRLAWKTTEGARQPVDPKETERLARTHPSADSLPPYDAFYPTTEGILWVVEAAAEGDSLWWATGFRSDGAILGRLRGPRRLIPVAFSRASVVVKSEDRDGLVTISRYRLLPARN